jgi:hypothetical protein
VRPHWQFPWKRRCYRDCAQLAVGSSEGEGAAVGGGGGLREGDHCSQSQWWQTCAGNNCPRCNHSQGDQDSPGRPQPQRHGKQKTGSCRSVGGGRGVATGRGEGVEEKSTRRRLPGGPQLLGG